PEPEAVASTEIEFAAAEEAALEVAIVEDVHPEINIELEQESAPVWSMEPETVTDSPTSVEPDEEHLAIHEQDLNDLQLHPFEQGEIPAELSLELPPELAEELSPEILSELQLESADEHIVLPADKIIEWPSGRKDKQHSVVSRLEEVYSCRWSEEWNGQFGEYRASFAAGEERLLLESRGNDNQKFDIS